MSAATQGTTTMLEAIDMERERDRYKAALRAIAPVVDGVRRGRLGVEALGAVDERIGIALSLHVNAPGDRPTVMGRG